MKATSYRKNHQRARKNQKTKVKGRKEHIVVDTLGHLPASYHLVGVTRAKLKMNAPRFISGRFSWLDVKSLLL